MGRNAHAATFLPQRRTPFAYRAAAGLVYRKPKSFASLRLCAKIHILDLSLTASYVWIILALTPNEMVFTRETALDTMYNHNPIQTTKES